MDCSPIKSGGACFEPNTILDHASFVFNTYFKDRACYPTRCNFGGDATITKTNPLPNVAADDCANVWCVANPKANRDAQQKDIDVLCNTMDCSPIKSGGACFEPNTVLDHASFVFNTYFKDRACNPSTCNFGGDATTTKTNPLPNVAADDCANVWCVANPKANRDAQQKDIDVLCNTMDCSPIKSGGACFEPNTVLDHASFVFNTYFKDRACNPSTCNFGGDATTTKTNP
ncbi:unnamed protein product, partial [Musa hybrid cultivar]